MTVQNRQRLLSVGLEKSNSILTKTYSSSTLDLPSLDSVIFYFTVLFGLNDAKISFPFIFIFSFSIYFHFDSSQNKSRHVIYPELSTNVSAFIRFISRIYLVENWQVERSKVIKLLISLAYNLSTRHKWLTKTKVHITIGTGKQQQTVLVQGFDTDPYKTGQICCPSVAPSSIKELATWGDCRYPHIKPWINYQTRTKLKRSKTLYNSKFQTKLCRLTNITRLIRMGLDNQTKTKMIKKVKLQDSLKLTRHSGWFKSWWGCNSYLGSLYLTYKNDPGSLISRSLKHQAIKTLTKELVEFCICPLIQNFTITNKND